MSKQNTTLLKLFDAYVETIQKINFIEKYRPKRGIGILVGKDKPALRWQKLNKKEKKLRLEIRARLAELEGQAQ